MIADAPWIREAEMYGVDDGPEIRCPICDEECEEIILDNGGDVCGCEHCTRSKDAYEWYQDRLEAGRDV